MTNTDLQCTTGTPTFQTRLVSSASKLIPGLGSAGISNLIKKAVHGSSWTLLGYGAGQVLRLTTQLVLAHVLLGPTAFGIVALVNVFLSGLEMLSDLGIGMDVVQHPRGDEPSFINTAYVIQLIRGAVLFVIAAGLAYPFALFYHQPAARNLVIVAALSTLIRGFTSGSIWTMTRRLEFKTLGLLNIASEVVGLVVSLVWIYLSPSVWALVVGRVAAPLALTVGSHMVGRTPVKLEWDRDAARDILAFGAGIFFSTATYFLSGESERLIVGKFANLAELGCFSLALSLSAAPAQALMQLAGQVFFPMISNSIREDTETAARHYKKARSIFVLLSVGIGVIFVVFGPRLVALLLPAKFAMAGWMLQLLGVRSALQVFAAPTTSLVFAYGNSRYAAISNAVRFALMTCGLWLAFTRYGIHAAIVVLVVASFAAYLVMFPAVARFQPAVFRFELASSALFAGCLAVAAVVPMLGSLLLRR